MSKDNVKTRLLICNEANDSPGEGFVLSPDRNTNPDYITGYVITSIDEDGKAIWLSLDNKISINKILDVEITSPNLRDCLMFDGKTWKNTSLVGKGVLNFNGSRDAIQAITFSNKGVDLNIKTTNGVHTFNVPDASYNSRGVLSVNDWKTFDGKLSSNLPNGGLFIGNSYSKAEFKYIHGDASLNEDGLLTLSDTAVISGTYTSPILTVDSKGRITDINTSPISGVEGSIQFKQRSGLLGVNELTFNNGKLNVGHIRGQHNLELSAGSGDLIFSKHGLLFKWPTVKPKLNQILRVKSINGPEINLSFDDEYIKKEPDIEQTNSNIAVLNSINISNDKIAFNFPITTSTINVTTIESNNELVLKSGKCIHITFPDSTKMSLPNTAPYKNQMMRCSSVNNGISIMEFYSYGIIQLGIEEPRIISSTGEIIPFNVTFSRGIELYNGFIQLDAGKAYLLYVFVSGKYLEVEWIKSDKTKVNPFMKSHNGELTFVFCPNCNTKIAISSILMDDTKVILDQYRNIVIVREI
jgi:hypothetical protein